MEPQSESATLRHFVEDFAAGLVEAGLPRMPARVFSCLLVSQTGRLTAAQLAEQLMASPAAISGAIGVLSQLGLVRRTREPGSRRDVYVVDNDVWYRSMLTKDQLVQRWLAALEVGIGLVGRASPAGQRLAETREFFAFVLAEMDQLIRRWEQHRQGLRVAAGPEPGPEPR